MNTLNLTFVAIGFLVSVGFMWAVSSKLVGFLNRLGFRQIIREEGPQEHAAKQFTPTAAGLSFLACIPLVLIVLFFWQHFSGEQADWVNLGKVLFLAVLGLGIGFADDYLKKVKKHNEGLKPKQKLAAQIALCLLTAWLCQRENTIFFNWEIYLGTFGFAVFCFFVLAGSMNASNLTDGLDGLAASVLAWSYVGLGVLTWFKAFELSLLSFVIAGICLGFLKANWHPAKVFMGDTGSLFLGACLALIAIFCELEWYLLLLAAVPIWETLSVMLQVLSCKLSKKFLNKDLRPFKMTPFHHHLELSGMPETKVVLSLASTQALFVIVALCLFKYFFEHQY